MKNIHILTKSGIYCLLNLVNGKTYIGSSNNVYHRIAKHRSELKHNRHLNPIIVNSVNKHGIDAFVAFSIEYCNKEVLLEREQYWLDLFNCEYNITRQVITNTLSEESRKKVSETLKQRYKEGLKSYRQDKNWIEVHQYSLDGEYIASYPCIHDAGEITGLRAKTISEAIRLNKGMANGFQWRKEKVDRLDAITKNVNRGIKIVSSISRK